jgi:predicted esterase
MTPTNLGFQHRYIPAAQSRQTLLLLHGTGGDENDLLAVGRQLDPAANLLSPRGKVLEQGMPRFFRRLAEGRFDETDLIHRTHELADFVAVAAQAYDFDPAQVIAVGYSNGANIAASTLLLRPATLANAVLLHPMVPLEPAQLPDLHARAVLISAGSADPLVPPAETERLASVLQRANATVTVQWWPGGHGLVMPAITAAHTWLKQLR